MIKNLLFWTVFPPLIPQALYVRWTAPRFAPAGGPTEGVVGNGEQCRLLAIGDSIIAGVGASELSKALVGQTAKAIANSKNCSVSWQSLGVSGYDSTKVLERLVPKLTGDLFDYVIVSVGVNDVTGLTSTKKWRGNLTQLIKELQAHSPGTLIGLAGLPPLGGFPLLPQPLRATLGLRGRVLDEVAREVADGYDNTLHVPLDIEPATGQFAADGYHPSEESYAEFGQQMAEHLLVMEAAEKGSGPYIHSS